MQHKERHCYDHTLTDRTISTVALRAQRTATEENTCKWTKHKQSKKTSSSISQHNTTHYRNALQVQKCAANTENENGSVSRGQLRPGLSSTTSALDGEGLGPFSRWLALVKMTYVSVVPRRISRTSFRNAQYSSHPMG